MSWESAANVLYAESPTSEQISALLEFAESRANELRHFWEPQFADQRNIVCKFVARLFVLFEKREFSEAENASKLPQTVDKIANMLVPAKFFSGVFEYALSEGDVALLQLVDMSLFTEIVFDSDLTREWFEKKREFEHLVPSFSPLARALITVVSAQFLDVRQDWSASKPSTALLLSLDTEISRARDPTLQLVWNLALYNMARSFYAAEKECDYLHGIKDVMENLQTRAGVHWSEVLRDQLQLTLPGIQGLVNSLEVVESSGKLEFLDGQLLAQTVADVVSCLLEVSKPTETLCAALATAVGPWPALQRVSWVPAAYVELTKAKAPASLASLVSLAQTMDTETRYEYLRDMQSYVSIVDLQSLDEAAPEIGQDVRTTKIVSVLDARPTDNQGTLELDVGTRGTLLAQNGSECLVMWYFSYNGWGLLGRILENNDLSEGDDWTPLTVEILKLVTMTLSTGVQTALSTGLARGDVVDLMADRLQSWIHGGHTKMCGLAFDFFAEVARLDPCRVWVFMAGFSWSNDPEVLSGAKQLLLALWPSFDASKSLHQQAAQNLVVKCAAERPFDKTTLEVFRHLLPVYKDLQEELLGTSSLRETAVAPFLAHLESAEMLDFCTFCVKFANEDKESKRTELSYFEKQLFLKSKELLSLFQTNLKLRSPIIRLWTALMSYQEAPPLLAFLNDAEAKPLKEGLVAILSNRLESLEIINALALFMVSAHRQESLVDLLWSALMPLFEDRANKIDDPETLGNIIRSLTLLKGGQKLQPQTLKRIRDKIIADVDAHDFSALEVKYEALRLLCKQVVSDPDSVKEFVMDISSLIPKLAKTEGIRPSLHTRLYHNMRSKWPAVVTGDSTAAFDLDLPGWDSKLDDDPLWRSSYRAEMLEAIDNKRVLEQQAKVVNEFCHFIELAVTVCKDGKEKSIDWACKLLAQNSLLLPAHLQLSETKRTETALVLLSLHAEASPDLLQIVYNQLTNAAQMPTSRLPRMKGYMDLLLQIAVLVLAQFDGKQVKLEPICLGLLDVFVIKQAQTFGDSQETLKLHLLLLRNCLRLLGSSAPRSLVQSMTESGSGHIILGKFMATPASRPAYGLLLLLYIQEWLPTDIMTGTFVRNGLINILIEAPLARRVQEGGVTAATSRELHSLWCQGMLNIVLRLLKQLGARIAQEAWLFVSIYSAQISTCQEQWRSGHISLGLVEETLLIHALLRQLSRLDTNPNDRVEVGFDGEEVVRLIDVLLSHRQYLVARTSEREDIETVVAALREVKDIVGN